MPPHKPRPELRVWTQQPAFIAVCLVLLTGLAAIFMMVGATMLSANSDPTVRCGSEEMRYDEVCIMLPRGMPPPSAVDPSVGKSYAEVRENAERNDGSLGRFFLVLAGMVVFGELVWIMRIAWRRRRARSRIHW